MNKKIEISIRCIETYLFGEYFKKLAQGNDMRNIVGNINTGINEDNLNIPRFDSIDECKELLDYLGKERELIDSKYDYMGKYTILQIKFHYIEIFNGEDKGYVPELKIHYEFDNLDWDKVKKI